MESAATPTRRCGCAHHAPVEAVAVPKCACRRLVVPRRLHALNGAWIAAFLTIHLLIGASGAWPVRYQRNVEMVRAISRIPGLDAVLIFLPLLVQALSGLYLLRQEGIRYAVKRCNRGGQVRFFMQRITAMAILAFVVVHVGTLHGWGYGEAGLFRADAAFRSTAAALRTAWVAGFTLLATGAAAFHAANGAWTGALVWNLLPSAERKRRWGSLCLTFGLALSLAGAVAWWAFVLSSNARVAG
jgi:succinate dehydrogenase / fumarate reductase cytochrome b subunit